MTEKVVAVYPGTFDPVTNGHLDVIGRAVSLFAELRVAVFNNSAKVPLFSLEERREMLEEATARWENVRVETFSGLTVEYARLHRAKVIVRGLRAVLDFEHEFQMALMNKQIASEVETLFLLTSSQYGHLSSTMVRELAFYGAALKGLVPGFVEERLRYKYRTGQGIAGTGGRTGN